MTQIVSFSDIHHVTLNASFLKSALTPANVCIFLWSCLQGKGRKISEIRTVRNHIFIVCEASAKRQISLCVVIFELGSCRCLPSNICGQINFTWLSISISSIGKVLKYLRTLEWGKLRLIPNTVMDRRLQFNNQTISCPK